MVRPPAFPARLIGSLVATALFTGFAVAASDDEVPMSAIMAKPLAVGATAPDANLLGLDGDATTLKDVLGSQPTVLIFYRGGWCPYCNKHLADLSTIEADLKAKGYQLVAITPDTPTEIKKTMDKHHLTYKIYSDSSSEALKKFGVAFQVDDATVAKYKDSYHVDLEASAGNARHYLPVPSVFLIDKDGKITYAHSNPDYRVRLDAKEILKVASGN